MDISQNYSEITDTSSRLVLRIPAENAPIESTRLSAASIITMEDVPSRDETEMDTNHGEEFDVTRSIRDMPTEEQET